VLTAADSLRRQPLEFPFVTVVILNYNNEQFLEDCLVSVQNQTYPNYEVIIVDNASTDNSLLLLKKTHHQIIQNKTNVGYTQGMNIGIKRARGDFLALLNADLRLNPDWLKELMNTITQDSSIGACSGKQYSFSGVLQDMSKYQINNSELSSVSGCAFLCSKKALEKVGLFDERLFMYFDEIDLCWRMRLAGYKCVYVPKAVIYHYIIGGSKATNEAKVYLNMRNQIRSILKNCGVFTLLPYLGIASTKLITASVKHRYSQLISYFNAWLWNLSNLPNTIQERLKIQRTRKLSDRQLGLYNLAFSSGYLLMDFKKIIRRRR
jgi:GT2 family glycosyltransferase